LHAGFRTRVCRAPSGNDRSKHREKPTTRIGCAWAASSVGVDRAGPTRFSPTIRLRRGDTTCSSASEDIAVPLAWVMIGEADRAGRASTQGRGSALPERELGNAPELIIAPLSGQRLVPDVVRGSLAGRRRRNLLVLVLRDRRSRAARAAADRFSCCGQRRLVLICAVLFLVPSVPGVEATGGRQQPRGVTIQSQSLRGFGCSCSTAVTRSPVRRQKRTARGER